ncbi:MAG: cob(I)yrinic acid a,c-diamide adenosyltransferase [Fibromonadaceae bacterium]|jgi:cob(I)alamin adenosyltransferase|nr:cob(I)yrinic acid a,c-diamide adenosyltransferase [Fibromonadaceae bacterium]
MRISKVYTRTGDKGSTALIGGERVPKSHLRLECYGTIDELNAFTGKLKLLCKVSFLENIQKTLSDIGAILATPSGKEWNNMPSINETHIKELENEIDKMNSELEPLKSFTVPGENEINAEAHVCRTVCRRAERVLCSAQANGVAISDFTMAYINRLSDYFFVLSRYA